MKVDFYIDVYEGQKNEFYVHDGTMRKYENTRRFKFVVDIPLIDAFDEDLGEVKAEEKVK